MNMSEIEYLASPNNTQASPAEIEQILFEATEAKPYWYTLQKEEIKQSEHVEQTVGLRLNNSENLVNVPITVPLESVGWLSSDYFNKMYPGYNFQYLSIPLEIINQQPTQVRETINSRINSILNEDQTILIFDVPESTENSMNMDERTLYVGNHAVEYVGSQHYFTANVEFSKRDESETFMDIPTIYEELYGDQAVEDENGFSIALKTKLSDQEINMWWEIYSASFTELNPNPKI